MQFRLPNVPNMGVVILEILGKSNQYLKRNLGDYILKTLSIKAFHQLRVRLNFHLLESPLGALRASC